MQGIALEEVPHSRSCVNGPCLIVNAFATVSLIERAHIMLEIVLNMLASKVFGGYHPTGLMHGPAYMHPFDEGWIFFWLFKPN